MRSFPLPPTLCLLRENFSPPVPVPLTPHHSPPTNLPAPVLQAGQELRLLRWSSAPGVQPLKPKLESIACLQQVGCPSPWDGTSAFCCPGVLGPIHCSASALFLEREVKRGPCKRTRDRAAARPGLCLGPGQFFSSLSAATLTLRTHWSITARSGISSSSSVPVSEPC